MPRNWNAVVERSDGVYRVDDCKQAFHQLLSHQCLYRRFLPQVTSYRIISANRPEYEEAVELAGYRLHFKDRLEFCCIVPDVAKETPLDMQHTAFLLVLRRLYHDHASVGDISSEGDAVVTADEVVSTYRAMSGKALDKTQGVVKSLIKSAWQNGLAKEIDPPDDDPQPFAIAILPGIAEVLSEHAVGRLGAQLKAALAIAKGQAAAAAETEVEAQS